VAADCLLQKTQRGLLIPLGGEEQGNRLAVLIHRTIQRAPRVFAADVGLVITPFPFA
jgi:hypothetical protein